jgi:3-hydroxyacyl-[acyl-carrier-protein] dehydratase
MNVNEIMKLLPHRYPFLLVDRVEEIEANKRIVAYKNITLMRMFLMATSQEPPIFPGVMIVEALAQASGILGFHSSE